MTDRTAATSEIPSELEQLVAESDTGGRKPVGLAAQILLYVAVFWLHPMLFGVAPLG